MRPSTWVKAGAALATLGFVGSLHLILPVASRKFSGAETGMPGKEGKHVVAYAANLDDATRFQVFADDFTEAFVRRWKQARGAAPPSSRARLYMFVDRAAFARHSLVRTGSALEFNGGYYSPMEHAICLVAGDEKGLRHELTHMIQHSSWPQARLSPWLSEGQAQWHESGVEGGPGVGVEKARDLLGSWRTLREIVEAARAEFSGADNEVFYAQSASLYAWLATERRDALERVILMERQGQAGDVDAFAQAVGGLPDDIEKAWRAWAAE